MAKKSKIDWDYVRKMAAESARDRALAEQEKKKMLDKMREKAYNILIKGKGEFLPLEDTSVSLGISKAVKEVIEQYSKKALKSSVKYFGDRPLILAGGAIRDMAVGVPPKDYDFFIPCKGMDEKELDDSMVMFLLDLEQEEPVAKLSKYAGTGHMGKQFVVYESGQIQLICDLSSEKPLDIINSFDYNLVMGYYDPRTKKFEYSPLMVDGLKKKQIVGNPLLKDKGTEYQYRAASWMGRTPSTRGMFQFPEVKQETGKAKKVKFVANEGVHWARVDELLREHDANRPRFWGAIPDREDIIVER